ncbi:MAG: diguanylate cyclase (GGDEF)-like protein [Psychromonas sp.]|jgi:diguanylate cyclase (GGDEF)-like protein|uniref:diguanylate cyclase domain-containing protein n=1 Tax=Psychromonas sp. TaxID=1884585 RepID=UPI0039E6D788
MSQYKPTEDNGSSDTFDFDLESSDSNSKAVVELAKYKQSEDAVNAQTSAFAQVMSQMNIVDRSAFDKKYSQLWQEASNEDTLLSVFLCEIDFFNAYNDNYGQQGASFMLLVVGLALKNICEKHGCFLAHYQKEEFGILMKGGDQKQASEIAESMREAVEASHTEHKYSSVNSFVTLSIGVSSLYPSSMKVLMGKVDGALDQAKKSGRNQVFGDFPQKTENSVAEVPVTTEKNKEAEKIPDDIEESNFKQFLLDMEVADRTAFNKDFGKLWKESCDEKEMLSMIICGFDYFQPFTEHYGTQASEDALLIVAFSLQQTCEKYGGFVYHLSDENFIVLLKGGNATQALRIAEQIHLLVAEVNTEHKCSEVSDVITVSIGLSSTLPSHLNSMALLRDESKKAFHAAIKAGRNQTSVF